MLSYSVTPRSEPGDAEQGNLTLACRGLRRIIA